MRNDRYIALPAFYAALAPVLFSIVFFGILPSQGLDLEQFGDPEHVLTVFYENSLTLRLIGLNNILLMFCAGIVAAVLPYRLTKTPSEALKIAGLIATMGWLIYLIGELFDLTAYINLPAMAVMDKETATQGFIVLQHAGRFTHCLAYGVIGVGITILAMNMTKAMGWSTGLKIAGLCCGLVNIIIFLVEYFYTSFSGDAGTGEIFNALLALNTLLLAVWHGWIGVTLWRNS